MQWMIGVAMTALTHLFKSRLGLFLASALIWLGINFATVNIVLDPVIDLVNAYAGGMNQSGSGLAAAAGAWIGVLQFDKALTMVISAFATQKLLMQGRLYLFKRGVGA